MTMSSVSPEDSVTIKTTVSISPDNPAFDGHFSGFPVYPGVAQIQNVCDLLSEHFGRKVNLTQISRTKFLSLVAPSSVLEVSCLVNRAWSEFPDSALLVAEKCSFTESKLRFSSSSRLDSENLGTSSK